MANLVSFNKNRRDLSPTGFESFYDVLDNFFDDAYNTDRSLSRHTFKVDVQDNENEFLIEAELPGVNKDEIKLEMMENRLTIGVERKEEVNEEEKNYIHKERRYSSMQRCIYLKDAKADDIEAKLDNGVLTVKIPKDKEKVTVKKIDVK